MFPVTRLLMYEVQMSHPYPFAKEEVYSSHLCFYSEFLFLTTLFFAGNKGKCVGWASGGILYTAPMDSGFRIWKYLHHLVLEKVGKFRWEIQVRRLLQKSSGTKMRAELGTVGMERKGDMFGGAVGPGECREWQGREGSGIPDFFLGQC